MRVRVLGPLELDGADAPAELTRKARQVVTLLALAAPGALSAERIADSLWDEPPAAAIKTVQAHISRARRALPGAITGSSSGYALALDEMDVDVSALRALRRVANSTGDTQQKASALERARALLRGEAELPSTVVGDAARLRLRDLEGTLVDEHLRALVDAGRSADALVEIEAAIAADPLREGLWATRMLALYRCGRQADALRAYQDARRVLTDEAGVEPGPELRQVEAAILAQDESLDVTVPLPTESDLAADLPRYAAVDGRHVAYATFGTVTGKPDLLVLMPGFITIDAYLEEPRLASTLRRLSSSRRVLALDRSGIGLSDPLVAEREPTLDQWVDDVIAVLDDAGARTVDVLANADTCLLAILVAARHPTQVASLTLLDPYARIVRTDDYPYGMRAAEIEAVRSAARRPRDATTDQLAFVAPSMTSDAVFRAWWDRVGRRSASPRTADRLLEVVGRADVRGALPSVQARTLVMIRTGCPSYDPGHGRYLAAHVRGAEVVESAGTDDLWWVGDDGFLDHLDRVRRASP